MKVQISQNTRCQDWIYFTSLGRKKARIVCHSQNSIGELATAQTSWHRLIQSVAKILLINHLFSKATNKDDENGRNNSIPDYKFCQAINVGTHTT